MARALLLGSGSDGSRAAAHHPSTRRTPPCRPRPRIATPAVDEPLRSRCHRDLQAHPLGHRPRRHPRPRSFDSPTKFLPDGLSKVAELAVPERRARRGCSSQIQGRTYANIFGLVERFIGAKVLERQPRALARRPDRARGAGALHRRGAQAPGAVPPHRADVGREHAGRLPLPCRSRTTSPRRCSASRTWAVLALDLPHRALHAGALPRRASSPTPTLSPLWKDVFLFHWKEESQHAILDELEWPREDAQLDRGRARRARSTTSSRWSAPSTASCRCRRPPTCDYFLRSRAAALRRRRRRSELRDGRAQGLPLAVHRLRCPAPALHEDADRDDHPRAGRAHHAALAPIMA